MLKKLMGIMLTLVLTLSLTGCSFFEDDTNTDETKASETSKDDSVQIKTVNDFTESEGLIRYFTIEDYKFAIPETVGEYANYLEQLGTVTLNETGKSVNDVELNAGGVSSMAAYLKVTTEDNEEARLYVRYENKTDDDITVAEASVTYLEIKYDIYSEFDYDKVFNSVVIYLGNGKELPLKTSYKMEKVSRLIGSSPEQNTDGRLHYSDNLGRKYIFDCCNENRDGSFRGFIIEYPSANE